MTGLLPDEEMPARVIVGDALESLRRLPDGCVHCCVTSPPYFALRDYGVAGQIGLESTPEAFIARLVEVFRELRRVLHPSGVAFVNMGDSYNAHPGQRKTTDKVGPKQETNAGSNTTGSRSVPGFKPKDLMGIPWRLAFALQADGWFLRSDIPWVKRSAMPESVTDRPAKALEYVFLLTKRDRYFFDMEAVRVGDDVYHRKGTKQGHKLTQMEGYKGLAGGTLQRDPDEPYGFARDITTVGRNFRNADLWFQSIEGPHGFVGVGDELVGLDVTSEPFPGAHFATFPSGLVEPLILAGTSAKGVCPACLSPWMRVTAKGERIQSANGKTGSHKGRTAAGQCGATSVLRDGKVGTRHTTGWEPSCKCPEHSPIPATVLDPFAGSGTTLAVALRLQRRAVGIELNPAYAKLIEKRLAEPLGVGGLFPPAEPVTRDLFTV